MEMTILRRNDRNGVVVAFLKGIVDGESSQMFEKKILDLISQEDKFFIINMSETEYITSAGLRSFLVIGKLLRSRRGRIAVSNFNESVGDVFKMMNFDSLFAMYATEDEAFGAICAPGPETTVY
jgi:anti-sigma B factor antagonist